MQLLSVALVAHDASLAWSDGGTVRYLKVERARQEKRFAFASLADWKAQARAAWDLPAAAFDEVAFTLDPGAIPPPLRPHFGLDALQRLARGDTLAEPLAPALCEHLGVRAGWLVGHHYCHALSAWMLQPHPTDIQIVIDGVGDGRPWSVYRGDRLVAAGDLQRGSIGWGMRDAGKLLGIRAGHANDIAGKLMGLQAYGQVDAGYLAQLGTLGFDDLRALWSPQGWEAWRGDPLVARLGLLDWAATVHRRQGELLLAFFAQHAQPAEAVAYAGGVAQNVVWNTLLRERFPRLVVPPHASDEGLSLGGLEWLRRHRGQPPLRMPGFPFAQSDHAVPPPSPRTVAIAADLLVHGKVVGWYQGAGEVGPRALGHRSILMDPRLPRGKALLNRVKQREPYRPFGASVLAEHHAAHFSGAPDSFMLFASGVRGDAFPAITHVDGSCRVQAVEADGGPLRALLERFHALSGCPVLANTSLNLAGKPLAAHPDHARRLFADSVIDAVVIGDEVLVRP